MSITAKLFNSGRSQAVRLPQSLRFEGDKVIAKRFGNGVLLLPIDNPWQLLREAVDEFEPELVLERQQPEEQGRDAIAANSFRTKSSTKTT